MYCDVLIRQVVFLEVKCDCRSGFIGDGFSCAGNLLQVLQDTPTFSNFLTVSCLLSSGELRKHFLFVAGGFSDFPLFGVTRLQDVNDGSVSDQDLDESFFILFSFFCSKFKTSLWCQRKGGDL